MSWSPCWRTEEVLQHSDSIVGSVILCGTFRRISQLWGNAHTLNLENCRLYSSSIIPQFLDFIRCRVFDFIFYCVTTHTLYLRGELILVQPRVITTKYGLNTLKYYGPKIWNSLNDELRSSPTFKKFVTHIRKITFDACNCSLCNC